VAGPLQHLMLQRCKVLEATGSCKASNWTNWFPCPSFCSWLAIDAYFQSLAGAASESARAQPSSNRSVAPAARLNCSTKPAQGAVFRTINQPATGTDTTAYSGLEQ